MRRASAYLPAALPLATPPAKRRTASRANARAASRKPTRALARTGFAYLAAGVDAAAIVFAAFASDWLYRVATLGLMPNVQAVTMVGVVVALLFVLSTAQRGEYDLKRYASRSGQVSRAFPVWNFAFVIALVVGFATKTTSEFSRGAAAAFYLAGFLSAASSRLALVNIAASMHRAGLAVARRVVVVGFEDRLAEVLRAGEAERDGVETVGVIALRDNQAYLADDLALAAAAVRMYRPDDVRIAIPWSRPDLLEACADAFLRTPAEIHLAADGILERYGEAKVARLGGGIGLQLTRPPLTWLQRLEKRMFDLVVAALALIALFPLLAAVAIAIRLDSPGPILFRQKRYGFNQEPFRIYKFRSMTTLDDGAHVAQAVRGDARVTRVGRHIRRLSLDELPQLLNVLRGEMSIVGPRPHALAHDQRYVERIARYARRHNVKPGITGWAQVRGHRGEIANDSQMRDRLAHDLHYVDHWSTWLDFKIVVMTIFAASAHCKAY
jgi:Undecaprenyl-phosphate glucose phosphotransferase